MNTLNQEHEWLMRFGEPDTSVLSQIERLLISLPCGDDAVHTQDGEAMVLSSTGEVMRLLEKLLHDDFKETAKHAEAAPWRFDFVVYLKAESRNCLHIMTRLYHPTKAGNIFYGRTVVKNRNDRYLLWAE